MGGRRPSRQSHRRYLRSGLAAPTRERHNVAAGLADPYPDRPACRGKKWVGATVLDNGSEQVRRPVCDFGAKTVTVGEPAAGVGAEGFDRAPTFKGENLHLDNAVFGRNVAADELAAKSKLHTGSNAPGRRERDIGEHSLVIFLL